VFGTGAALLGITEFGCSLEAHMAKQIIKVGGWYIAYEISSTAALAAIVAAGFRIPGF
jgi:hypothetical protein